MIRFIIYLLLISKVYAVNTLRVYVLDTGFDFKNDTRLIPYSCADGHFNMSLIKNKVTGTHGTDIAKIITKGLPLGKFCLVSVNFINDVDSPSVDGVIQSLKYILTQPPGIVNISLSGPGYNREEHELLLKLVNRGFKLNIAAGNNRANLDNLCSYYPGCYFIKPMESVNVISSNKDYANKRGPVTYMDDVETGGTSNNTAHYTNISIRKVIQE